MTLYTKDDDAPAARSITGRIVEVDARVRKPRNYGNPGRFRLRRRTSRRQDIYWTASGAAGSLRVLPGRCGSRFQKAVMDLRQAALDAHRPAVSPTATRPA